MVVARTDILKVVAMPNDGNCLFTAFTFGYRANIGLQTSEDDQLLRAIGATCRTEFLKRVVKSATRKREVLGVPVDSLLTDLGWTSVGEYIVAMQPPIESRRQWGGFPEAVIMCDVWDMQVAFFVELDGGDVAMLTEPVGTGTKGPLLTQTRGPWP